MSQPRETKDVSQASGRGSGGRTVPSRYMNATASSKAAVTSKPAIVQQKTSSSTLGPVKHSSAASIRSKHPANAISTTKRPAAPSQTISLSVSRARPERTGAGSNSSHELDVASQLYPWLFMRHTLAEASSAAVTKSQAMLAAHAKQLDTEEETLADDRLRYQAERETQLIDELSYERMCRVVPPLIRKFVQSEAQCQGAVSLAAQVTSKHRDWNLRDVRSQLQNLEQFAEESTILRNSIAELAGIAAPDSLIASTLDSVVRLLEARLENLHLSRELLARTRDNFMTARHLESLNISS